MSATRAAGAASIDHVQGPLWAEGTNTISCTALGADAPPGLGLPDLGCLDLAFCRAAQ